MEQKPEVKYLQENLALLRKSIGWTAEKLGSVIGVSRQSITNFESNPPRSELTQVHYMAIRAAFNQEIEEKPEEPTTPTVTEPETPTTPEVKDNSGMGETAVDNQKGFVAVDYANIRKQASTSSEIVTTLTKDTSFTITAETEDWYKITYTGIDGTVYEGYIYKNLATK